MFLDLVTESHDCDNPNGKLKNFVENGDPSKILKNLSLKNVSNRLKWLICAQRNGNSLRNKSDSLVDIVNNNTDILIISETKLFSLFPTGQFHIQGFSESYSPDRNSNDGGILLYNRDDIPSRLILTKMTIKEFLLKSSWER